MRARFASTLRTVLPALLLGLAILPGAAWADGDPASDVLLGENVFYPYTPAVLPALQKTLNAQTAGAAKAGFPIKVALIASPVDLGVIPDLFEKPTKYASFLDLEISYQVKQPVLVVMPAGLGGAGLGAAASNALKTLAKPAGAQSNDLARAAIPAVAKLAAAAGHPIKGVARAGGASVGGGSPSTVILIALVLAALATSAALIAIRRRRPQATA